MPPLYITHPIPRAQVACVKFIPHRDLLTIGHANGLSTIIVPGASNPHYDTAEGGDPYEGKKGRREREVRGLLEKLEPSTIVMDPDLLGGVAEEGKVPDVVHRKLPRLERLRQTGKADETGIAVAAEEAEAGSNDEQDGIIDEDAPKSLREKRQKSKMRGRDKSMKRYLKKKRKNVIDQATVRMPHFSPYSRSILAAFNYVHTAFIRRLPFARNLRSRMRRYKKQRNPPPGKLQDNLKPLRNGLH